MKVIQNAVLNPSFIILFEKKTVRASKNLRWLFLLKYLNLIDELHSPSLFFFSSKSLFIADVVNIKFFAKLKLVINHLFLFLRWISERFGATTLRKDNNRFHQLPIGKDTQKFKETSKQDIPDLMPLGFYQLLLWTVN